MPAAKSSGRSKPQRRTGTGTPKTKRSSGAKQQQSKASSARGGDGIAGFAEQLVNRVIKPLDLVVISRERIQETLDEAAERGRVTRADANELVTELVRRGRLQTDELFKDLERLLDRGGQIGNATRQSVGRIVRGADRARRSFGAGPALPIAGYDDLTAGQVELHLDGLKPAELRKVRDYERRHANRKSVLEAIERALA
jgi:polyhydroxyalkanoate synthesis regulator phasin